MEVLKLKIVEENMVTTMNIGVNSQTKSETVNARSGERTSGYHELPGLRHETKDVLQQLTNNIAMLEDLGGRLGFVMSEVRSLIRR